jgi:hypothetical protein
MGGDEHRVGGTRELCLVLRWFAGSGAGQLGKGQAFTGAGRGGSGCSPLAGVA